jgi:Peptidase family M1 domain
MKLRKLFAILVVGALAQLGRAAGAGGVGAPEIQNPLVLYRQLNQVKVDPSQIYVIREARISRNGINLYFDRGFIGLFTPVAGRITGAVFVGTGEVLLIPPNPAEKLSLARFTKSAVLEESITSAYMRFTDDTARELLRNAQKPDPADPEQPPADFAQQWNYGAGQLNAEYSTRILEDFLGAHDLPFFQARVEGVTLGRFELTDDELRPEAIRVDAFREVQGIAYGDIWCSYPSPASKPREDALRIGAAGVVAYKIDTRIGEDNSLEGRAELTLESKSSVARVLTFELSSQLNLLQATDEQGRKLIVLPEGARVEPSLAERSRDWFAVVLDAPQPVGSQFRLTFTYQGNVIKDVGNGVLYVGARGNWYPNRGFYSHAMYDLTFRYPERLTLVATGQCVEEGVSNGWKHSRWVSDGPFPVAGFNLGAYTSRQRTVGKVSIAVYATREAEAALAKRYQQLHPPAIGLTIPLPEGPRGVKIYQPPMPPPLDPSALLDEVLDRAANAVRYFDGLFGPFPYPRLTLAQIPGDFGQCWPELVYLPTLSFIPNEQRPQFDHHAEDLNVDPGIYVTHEIAHQWWGNEVGWKSYHDQWLSEGFASYAAALAMAQEKDGDRKFHELLDGYKQALLSKTPDGKTVESGGPIWLGQRLTNSLNPSGYDAIVYQKSCWVLHMLREVMTDPKTGSDERFFKMLRGFAEDYHGRNPSTEDFLKEASRYMTPQMDLDGNRRLDWFFDDWVYGTGIPAYKLNSKTRRLAGNRYEIQGTIEQSGVPDIFEMLVPVVAVRGRDRKVPLGRVVVGESGGKFRFAVGFKPSRVEIDAQNLLAVAK